MSTLFLDTKNLFRNWDTSSYQLLPCGPGWTGAVRRDHLLWTHPQISVEAWSSSVPTDPLILCSYWSYYSYWSSAPTLPIDPLFLLILLFLLIPLSSVPTDPGFLLTLCSHWCYWSYYSYRSCVPTDPLLLLIHVLLTQKPVCISGCLWSRVQLYLHFLMQSTTLVTIYLQLLANKMTWKETNTNLSVTKMVAMPWFNMRHDLSIHLCHTSPLFDILLIRVPISLSALPEVLRKIQTFHKF